MLIFGSSAGAYILHRFNEEETGGIEIKGLLNRGGGMVATGFTLQRRDSKFVQRCFGGANFVYGFGQDIGQMTVEAIAFVVPIACGGSASQKGANFDNIEKDYIDNSLTEKGVVQVSFPSANKTTQAFLTELSIQTQAVQTNIHMCRFDFLILDLSANQNQSGSGDSTNADATSGISSPADAGKQLAGKINALAGNLSGTPKGSFS